MSAPSSQAAQDDLRMMRELAEEGRSRPLLSGRHLLMFGGAIAIASALHGLVLEGVLDWPLNALPVIWIALILPAVVLSRMHRTGSADCAPSIGNKVELREWRQRHTIAVLALNAKSLICGVRCGQYPA